MVLEVGNRMDVERLRKVTDVSVRIAVREAEISTECIIESFTLPLHPIARSLGPKISPFSHVIRSRSQWPLDRRNVQCDHGIEPHSGHGYIFAFFSVFLLPRNEPIPCEGSPMK
jgi:hypothetical protein